MKQVIVVFGEENITVIKVGLLGNCKEEYEVTPYEEISDAYFVKGSIANKLHFKTDDGQYKFRCNKTVAGMKWQKENFEECLSHPLVEES